MHYIIESIQSKELGNVDYVEVDISDLNIPSLFVNSSPSKHKIAAKLKYYKQNGYIRPLVISSKYTVLDGYISYILAMRIGLTKINAYMIHDKGSVSKKYLNRLANLLDGPNNGIAGPKILNDDNGNIVYAFNNMILPLK